MAGATARFTRPLRLGSSFLYGSWLGVEVVVELQYRCCGVYATISLRGASLPGVIPRGYEAVRFGAFATAARASSETGRLSPFLVAATTAGSCILEYIF